MLHSLAFVRAALTATVLAALFPITQAQAAALFAGDSRGSFGAPLVDPSIDSEATFRVENPDSKTEAFLLGAPGPDSTPNQLSFTGQTFSVPSESAFSVGSLTYRNGQTFQGTNVSSVPLSISLNLSQPSQLQRSFDYQFTFSLTPNTDQTGSADSLIVSKNPAPQAFSIQDSDFSVELLGFSADNGETFTRSFQVPEDNSISSTLFAQISSTDDGIIIPGDQPTKVPEPSIFAGLLLAGAAMRLSRSDR